MEPAEQLSPFVPFTSDYGFKVNHLDKLTLTMEAPISTQQPPTRYPKFWEEDWLKIAIQALDTRLMTPEQRMDYEMSLAKDEMIRQEKEASEAFELKVRIEVAKKMIAIGATDETIAAGLKETLEFVQNIRLDMAKATSTEQKMA